MISIVIPTTPGREGNLVSLLYSFERTNVLSRYDIEFVIVSEFTDDNITRFFNDKFGDVKFVKDEGLGVGHAKQQGLDFAHGEIVGLIDDDVVVGEHFLDYIVKAFEYSDIVQPKVVFVNQGKSSHFSESSKTGKLKWNLMPKHHWNFGHKIKNIDCCCETCVFFSKKTLSKTKFHDKNLIGDAYGEDISFILRSNEKVLFEPRSVAYHLGGFVGGTISKDLKNRNTRCSKQLSAMVHNMLYLNYKYNTKLKYELTFWYFIISGMVLSLFEFKNCSKFVKTGILKHVEWIKCKQ